MSGTFLTAEWRHLAMLNYEVDPEVLRPLVPAGTELDAWSGKTFVSAVGFLFLKTKVLGIGIPFHRDFEEINLRFYAGFYGGGWASVLAGEPSSAFVADGSPVVVRKGVRLA